jgi:hypothetical protein
LVYSQIVKRDNVEASSLRQTSLVKKKEAAKINIQNYAREQSRDFFFWNSGTFCIFIFAASFFLFFFTKLVGSGLMFFWQLWLIQ